MIELFDLSIAMYNITLIPVVFLSVAFIVFAILNILFDDLEEEHLKDPQPLQQYPKVTVQIPCFNDLVAKRCVEHCLKLEYPKEKLQIMLVDDSTDKAVQETLCVFEQKHPGLISYVHRTNREGYKPGALRDAMPKVTGDIIVIFDSDFAPKSDFLKRIVVPFEDENVSIVQGRQGFMNDHTNMITRFASTLLRVQHHVFLPLNHKSNSVFFCGTAGAIRRSALEEVGGWNASSITEDADLSVKLLAKGYQNVYMKFETPSEVPSTLEAFLKQQMRWTFGLARVFFDNKKMILLKSKLNIMQRSSIVFQTLASFIAPIVLLMTIIGSLGWFLGELQQFTMSDVVKFALIIAYTSGFFVMVALTLKKRQSMAEFPKIFVATIALSLILSAANTVALYKAVFRKNKPLFGGKKNSWICTPKDGSKSA